MKEWSSTGIAIVTSSRIRGAWDAFQNVEKSEKEFLTAIQEEEEIDFGNDIGLCTEDTPPPAKPPAPKRKRRKSTRR